MAIIIDHIDCLTDTSLEVSRSTSIVDIAEAGLTPIVLPHLDGQLRVLRNDHD
jgi:hypothetical protein